MLRYREEFEKLFTSKSPNIAVVAARGTGKTVAAVQMMVHMLLRGEFQEEAFFFSKTLRQARETVNNVMSLLMQDYPRGFCEYNKSDYVYSFNVGDTDIRRLHLMSYENPESKRGFHPRIIVLDECASMPAYVFDKVIYPMISPHEGKHRLLCIGTAQGKNRFYDLWRRGQDVNFPDWESYTIKANNFSLFSREMLQIARMNLSPAAYAQEFECDFDANVIAGAYYGPLLEGLQLKDPEFISDTNTYDPGLPVHTSWDLGHSNNTSIWFFQVRQGNPVFIDFFEDSGKEISYYVNEVLGRGYVRGKAFLPHDADAKNIRSPITISEMLSNMHLPNVVLPPSSVQIGIEQTRLMLKVSKFNRTKCVKGLEHLRSYRRKIDFKTGVATGTPDHDEHSDAADAMRYAAMSKDMWQRNSSGDRMKVLYRDEFDVWS